MKQQTKRMQLRLPAHIYEWFLREQGRRLQTGERVSRNQVFVEALESIVGGKKAKEAKHLELFDQAFIGGMGPYELENYVVSFEEARCDFFRKNALRAGMELSDQVSNDELENYIENYVENFDA